MTGIALCGSIGFTDTSSAPGWLHLLPAGEARTVDGRGPYRVADASALMANSMLATSGRLVVCENHATDLAAPKGGPSPARGWIVELQQRNDGIWGRVEWTAAGRRLVEAREYRGLSPVISHKADGTVTAILRATLTNVPNLTGLKSLHSQGSDMDLRQNLIKIFDLPATSDDQAIVDKAKFLVKHVTGRDVAMMSAQMQAQQIAAQAAAYRKKMSDNGFTISLPAAVRAVQDGTAIL